jgi:hypothetical protein
MAVSSHFLVPPVATGNRTQALKSIGAFENGHQEWNGRAVADLTQGFHCKRAQARLFHGGHEKFRRPAVADLAQGSDDIFSDRLVGIIEQYPKQRFDCAWRPHPRQGLHCVQPHQPFRML